MSYMTLKTGDQFPRNLLRREGDQFPRNGVISLRRNRFLRGVINFPGLG